MERISASYQYNPYPFWKLDLSENPVDFEQVLSLITASSCNFGSLLLCKCWLTEYPIRNQLLALQINSIQFLQLDQNHFCDENINILVKIMASCHDIEILSCCQCGITSEDFRYLLSQLSNFGTIIGNRLREWRLNDNEIDDSGVSALIEFLSLFPNIHSLRVDGNPVSVEMKERLFGAVVSYTNKI
jgi:Ran GTPase-activating protein (RanGAP) involved in mRNA processing and transport